MPTSVNGSPDGVENENFETNPTNVGKTSSRRVDSFDIQSPNMGTPSGGNSIRSTPTYQGRSDFYLDGNTVADSLDGMYSPGRNFGTSPYVG